MSTHTYALQECGLFLGEKEIDIVEAKFGGRDVSELMEAELQEIGFMDFNEVYGSFFNFNNEEVELNDEYICILPFENFPILWE